MKYDLLFQNRRIARLSEEKVGKTRNLWTRTLNLCYFMSAGFCCPEAYLPWAKGITTLTQTADAKHLKSELEWSALISTGPAMLIITVQLVFFNDPTAVVMCQVI